MLSRPSERASEIPYACCPHDGLTRFLFYTVPTPAHLPTHPLLSVFQPPTMPARYLFFGRKHLRGGNFIKTLGL